MIYEYAVDPQLLINWAQDKRDYRQFIDAFGIGQTRILGGFPKYKKWRSLVLKSIPNTLPEISSSRVVELVEAIGEAVVTRNVSDYDGRQEWADNVTNENKRAPFDVIFVLSKASCDTEKSIDQDDIYDNPGTCWDYPHQVFVNRTAEKMSTAIGNMLRLSSHIVFVDPHIKVSPDKLDPITAHIKQALNNRVSAAPPLIEVLYDINSARSPSPDKLFDGVSRYLGTLSDQICLVIKQLDEIENGEKLHNRYILTELGGVSFGVGLDQGDENQTDEITLLSKDVYYKRWDQYTEGQGFKLVNCYSPDDSKRSQEP